MVFTCKLFPVAEPVGGNNFINYALDTAGEGREGSETLRGNSWRRPRTLFFGVSLNINLFYFLLRSQVN